MHHKKAALLLLGMSLGLIYGILIIILVYLG